VFIKTFKKAIALFVVAVFVLSLMPFAALADDLTGSLSISYASSPHVDSWGHGTYLQLKTDYEALVKMDFAGYEEILKNDNTRLEFTFTPRSGKTIGNFNVYAAPDACDQEDFSALTLADAGTKGYKDTNRPVVYSRTGEADVGTAVTGELNKANFLAALDENSANSSIAFWLTPAGGTTYATQAGTTLNITYDVNEIDNDGYAADLAAKLEEEVISDGAIVTENLTLPTKYYGATITWTSSDDSIITNNGVISDAKGAPATLTANITYTNAGGQTGSATKEIAITVGEDAGSGDDTVVELTDSYSQLIGNGVFANTDGDSVNNHGSYLYIKSNRDGFVKMNFAGYEEILRNPNTEIEFNFAPRGGSAGRGLTTFDVYYAPDALDQYADYSLLGNTLAGTLGFRDTTRPLAYTRAGDETLEAITAKLDKATFINVLEENAGNSDLAFWMTAPTGASSTFTLASGLTVKYAASEIDNDAYVAELAAKLEEDVAANGDTVKSSLNLPTKYHGATITWTSSNEDAILSDGTFVLDDGQQEVTLTAAITYRNIKGDEASINKTITVTAAVLPDEATATIAMTNYALTRGGSNNENVVQSASSELRLRPANQNLGFAQIDFAGYEEILENDGTEIVIYIGAESASKPITSFTVGALSDEYDDYDAATLVHTDVAGTLDYFAGEAPIEVYTRSDASEFTGTLEEAVSVQPFVTQLKSRYDDSKVTLLYEALGTQTRIDVSNYITITYDKNKINNQAYINGLLTWNDISAENANNVTKKLFLPANFGGAEVDWSFSENGIIDANGNILSTGSVTLTAEMEYTNILGETVYATKTFEVVVTDNADAGKVVIGTPSVITRNGIETPNLVITNNTDADASYKAYFASYVDDTLIGLGVQDVTVAAGSSAKVYRPQHAVTTGAKLKLILTEADGITPAMVAYER